MQRLEARMGVPDGGSYAAAWRRYRRSRLGFWILFLLFLPVMALSGRLFERVGIGQGNVLLVAFVWMILFLVEGYRKGNFECPRCGQLFFRKFDSRPWRADWVYNPFARRCMHCALPKWAEQ
jgi:hypothetical protein